MAQEELATLRIPMFKGTESRTEVLAFLRKTAAVVAKIPASNTKQADAATMMVFSFTDQAEVWLARIKRESPDIMNSYDDLLTTFKSRFLKAETPSDIARMQANLKQKPTETVDAFMDRCHNVQCAELKFDEMPQAVRADEAFKKGMATATIQKFLNGVKHNIRCQIMAAQANTLDEVMAVARRHEIAYAKETGNEKKSVNEIKPSDASSPDIPDKDKAKEEVAAIQNRFGNANGNNRGRGGRNNRGMGRGRPNNIPRSGNNQGRSNSNPSPFGNPNQSNNRMAYLRCDWCQQMGHGMRVCPTIWQSRRGGRGPPPQNQPRGPGQQPVQEIAYHPPQGEDLQVPDPFQQVFQYERWVQSRLYLSHQILRPIVLMLLLLVVIFV